MEEGGVEGRLVWIADTHTLRIGFGVAWGYHDDRSGVLCRLLEAVVPELPARHTLQQVDEVRINAQHHGLRLRVAHAAIVLNDVGLSADIHQTNEDEAAVINALGLQACDRGADDPLLDALHEGSIGKGHWGDRAHTARIGPGIALPDTLIVLSHGEQTPVLAVSCDEDRTFDPRQVLLNHHTRAGLAEASREEHLQLALRLLEAGANDDALACRQAVGLEHVGRLERAEVVYGRCIAAAIEAAIGCRRDPVALHEALTELLAPLETRPCSVRPHDEQLLQLRLSV